MLRVSRLRDRLQVAAMIWYVRLLRSIVVVAEWWPSNWPTRSSRSNLTSDQRGGSIGRVGPP